ncbi:hypothetical protein D3Y57_07220 [Sphingomonas paeninsulae]|uniref:PDZ domain-containing protein n=1 Tax=Sphingomonas paeninsulae TaxID=2319844 RepID=A0A494TFM1_SPHPE|nr:M48 family metallopeptidase [Sphingomonas paeninsulae]AYJ85803.1 hypothetical protein D3Y57_07220 [Sphingomonas paeninsulae]
MIAVFIALAIGASDPGIAALQEADARVAAIAWQLQTTNAPLCSETAPLAGFTIQTLAQYEPFARPAVAQGDALDRRPMVQAVVAGGTADRAGLKAGDIVLEIDGAPTPRELPPRASYDATAKTQAMIDSALLRPPLVLRILRGKVSRTVELTGVTGCSSRIEIVTGKSLNAEADGHYVQISGSLVDFAANDDELATIIAHELAHNILHHPLRLDTENTARGLFAKLGKRDTQIRKTEFEADRMAVWLVARAGYDVDAIVPFWMRLGERAGSGAPSDGTHPDWNERIDRAAAAVTEVKSQRAASAELLPTNMPR